MVFREVSDRFSDLQERLAERVVGQQPRSTRWRAGWC